MTEVDGTKSNWKIGNFFEYDFELESMMKLER